MFFLVRNKIRTDEELTPLEKKVVSIVNQEEDVTSFLEDVTQYGCVSGMVGALIYYTDTLKWYKKFKADINQLIKDETDSYGENVLTMLNGWDDSDPLIFDTPNQNLLAWYSFETVCNRILNDIQEG